MPLCELAVSRPQKPHTRACLMTLTTGLNKWSSVIRLEKSPSLNIWWRKSAWEQLLWRASLCTTESLRYGDRALGMEGVARLTCFSVSSVYNANEKASPTPYFGQTALLNTSRHILAKQPYWNPHAIFWPNSLIETLTPYFGQTTALKPHHTMFWTNNLIQMYCV